MMFSLYVLDHKCETAIICRYGTDIHNTNLRKIYGYSVLYIPGTALVLNRKKTQHSDRFGEVIDCVVMKNAESGRSRGFGFVTFSDPNNMDKVIQSCPHILDGRTIDPKPCNPRSMQQKPKRNTNWPKVRKLHT